LFVYLWGLISEIYNFSSWIRWVWIEEERLKVGLVWWKQKMKDWRILGLKIVEEFNLWQIVGYIQKFECIGTQNH